MLNDPQGIASWSRRTISALLLVFGFAIIIASHSCFYGQTTTAQEALTNTDIVKMVQGHISADIIVEQIRTSPGKYSLTTDSLLSMTQQGVPDTVIEAMQARMHRHHASGIPGAQPKRPAEKLNSSNFGHPEWKVENRHVGYSEFGPFGSLAPGGEDRWLASLTQFVSDHGHKAEVEVIATCPKRTITDYRGPIDAFALWFGIRYISPSDQVTVVSGYRREPSAVEPPTNFAPGTVDRYFKSLKTLERERQSANPKFVRYEVSIDGKSKLAEGISSRKGGALLRFETLYQGRSYRDEGNGPNDGDATPAGSLAAGYGARLIHVVLPLTNGDEAAVDIHPQDPSFREFAAGCHVPKDCLLDDDGHQAACVVGPPLSETGQYLKDARKNMQFHQFGSATADYQATLALDPSNVEAKAGLAAIQDVPRQQAVFLEGLASKGVWLDPKTKLMWTMKSSDKRLYWGEVKAYCSTLKTANLTGWNLPYVSQLETIFDRQNNETYHIKGGIHIRDLLWATSGDVPFSFDFEAGRYDSREYTDGISLSVICVRPYAPAKDGVGNPLEQ